MLNRLVVIAALIVSAGCVLLPKPKPPTPPDQELRAFAAVVTRADNGSPVSGARLRLGDQETTTGANGYGGFAVVAIPDDYTLRVDMDGFERFEQEIRIVASTPDADIRLKPVVVPPPPMPRAPTAQEVRRYKGRLSGLVDSAGRMVWTPALPGATDAIRMEWLKLLADAGATHVPVGPWTPGIVYDPGPNHPPVVHWENPDYTRNPFEVRRLLDQIRSTKTKAGHGMIPVIFVMDDKSDPRSRFDPVMSTVSTALEGIGPVTWTLPCSWETEGWRARECYDALVSWRPRSKGSFIAWHSWQNRSNGASNPGQADDVWLGEPDANGNRFGEWPRFWKDFDGGFLFQTQATQTIDEATCGVRGATNTDQIRAAYGGKFPEACWLNRAHDALARVGAGICTDDFGNGGPCGPGRRVFVFFESVAYYQTRIDRRTGRLLMEPGTDVLMSKLFDYECRKLGVECGMGQAFPQD